MSKTLPLKASDMMTRPGKEFEKQQMLPTGFFKALNNITAQHMLKISGQELLAAEIGVMINGLQSMSEQLAADSTKTLGHKRMIICEHGRKELQRIIDKVADQESIFNNAIHIADKQMESFLQPKDALEYAQLTRIESAYDPDESPSLLSAAGRDSRICRLLLLDPVSQRKFRIDDQRVEILQKHLKNHALGDQAPLYDKAKQTTEALVNMGSIAIEAKSALTDMIADTAQFVAQ